MRKESTSILVRVAPAAAVVLVVLLSLSAQSTRENSTDPTLILISLDGFRWDYQSRYETPALDRLAREGVRAEGLIPVFPTKTFPNHYSIVTGLYAEEHGIVSNNFFDPSFGVRFTPGNAAEVTAGRWWGGEPIWVTAERQGKRAATLFWVGSEAEIGGFRPSYWTPFDDSLPDEARVDQVLDWIDLPLVERPSFFTLYLSMVDKAGHRYGPDSPEVEAAVLRADQVLAHLFEGLDQRDLFSRVHIVVVSDHGMAPLSVERTIFLDDYIDLTSVRIDDTNPVAAIRPAPGQVEKIYSQLRSAHPRLTVYRKTEIPARLHFQKHRRIAPIIAIADEGWTIVRARTLNPRVPRGMHGFDNNLKTMQGLFLASGPSIRRGLVVKPFSCVHVYGLMAHILGLRPAPNSGRIEVVEPLLRDRRTSSVKGN